VCLLPGKLAKKQFGTVSTASTINRHAGSSCVDQRRRVPLQVHADPRLSAPIGVGTPRRLTEWHSRDLPSHIRGLCDQAIADGFPKWKDEVGTHDNGQANLE